MLFLGTILRTRRAHVLLAALVLLPTIIPAQSPSTRSSEAKPAKKSDDSLDPGVIANNVYRNKTLGLTCVVPQGWVLRTDEMNVREEGQEQSKAESTDSKKSATSGNGGKVLLAAFSRPPEARGEEINSSILIAAESASAYPDLKEAAQYFEPLIEVAKAQGFAMDEDPYDVAVGGKTLVRGDFHKDVGTRVMRQSTLAMLAHGYAISITMISGTDDGVEDLIDGLSFSATGK